MNKITSIHDVPPRIKAEIEENYLKSYCEKLYSPEERCSMGLKYFKDREIKTDYKEAYKWFMLSAKDNYEQAMSHIGIMFHDGLHVTKDYEKAYEWFMRSKDSHNTQYFLGIMYLKGNFVEKNLVTSVEWLTKASTNYHKYAMFDLAELYYNNKDLDQDYEMAIKWYRISAEHGNKAANKKLEEIATKYPGLLKMYDKIQKYKICDVLQSFVIKENAHTICDYLIA